MPEPHQLRRLLAGAAGGILAGLLLAWLFFGLALVLIGPRSTPTSVHRQGREVCARAVCRPVGRMVPRNHHTIPPPVRASPPRRLAPSPAPQ